MLGRRFHLNDGRFHGIEYNPGGLRNIALILAILSLAISSPAAPVREDFAAETIGAVSALQQWYDPHTGLWQTAGWWNSANCLEAVECATPLPGGEKFRGVIQKTFDRNSSHNFLNEYYDDEGWWALAWIHAYDLTKEKQYLVMAKTIFRDMTNGWDDHCGGGLWWTKERTYKNAIPNELFLTIAIRLHQRTPGDEGADSYYSWATREWTWFKASGMINAQNLINDGLTADCANNGGTTWSYNQGVILGGLTDLYKITGDTNYLVQAEAIANAAIKRLGRDGVLAEPREVAGSEGKDVPQFKGIFIHNLAYLYEADRNPLYFDFISKCAHSVWANDRNNENQLGLIWAGPFDSADAVRQSSAIMPLCLMARLQQLESSPPAKQK